MTMRTCKNCGKKFKPKIEKQEDCREICLVNRFDKLTRKTRKIARIFAGTMGYRSMSEVRFASRLIDAKLPFKYEADILKYQLKPQKYTPDFTLKSKRKKKKIFLEYKGRLDGPTRKKMLAVKKSNPDIDLRIVFEKPNGKLYKNSETRYWEWAEKNGFIWYGMKDIKQIKKDLKA
jgi:hypothetical protein